MCARTRATSAWPQTASRSDASMCTCLRVPCPRTARRPAKSTVGMTGEVTLQGRVLPIGGVKQKVLAAHRAGLTEVILPARNGPDLDDIPETVRDRVSFHLVSDVTEVLEHALEPVEAP